MAIRASLIVWIAEIASIAASIFFLLALVAVLATFDGEPIFDLYGVTLNAVVSILSTTSKAALLYVIGELISQWKWIIFTREERLLADFDRIDSASRGPLGSLKILWVRRTIGLVQAGAIIVLFSIAVDPFTQQLVQYKQGMVYTPDADTTTKQARRYSKGNEYKAQVQSDDPASQEFAEVHTFADADFSMLSAIFYGLDQPLFDVIQQSPYQCQTGNCTWPVFETLAVCSRCANVTHELKRFASDGHQSFILLWGVDASTGMPGNGTAFMLPNGHYIENQDGVVYGTSNYSPPQGSVIITTLGTTDASETITMQDLDTLIWSMSILRVTPNSTNSTAAWPNLPLSATECALYFCVKRYEAIVAKGTLQMTDEIVSDAFRQQDFGNDPGTFDLQFLYYHGTDVTLLSPTSGNTFNISRGAVNGLTSNFQKTFASTLSHYPLDDGRVNGYYVDLEEAKFEPNIIQALFSREDLNGTFTALAASMSNAIRRGADESSDGVSSTVTGKRGTVVTFYKIVWPWITLHVLVTVTGLAFLVITILENQKHGQSTPAWRSSSLATLSRGTLVRDILTGTESVKQMKKTANVTRVMLLEKAKYPPSLEEMECGPLETEE
ncbi:hypothetical protein F4803DRAFT_525272 [Xylaria telfairii]|nr:hypothetical protein F4803DRAFT_525272 [Xylaria telfairii]